MMMQEEEGGIIERLIMYNNVHFGDNFCIFNHTLFQDLRAREQLLNANEVII